MHKLTKFFAAAALSGLFLLPSLTEAGVRVYVRVGPPKVRAVKVVRPARPCVKAFWVASHYRHKHGRHVYVKGYWVKPRHGFVYVQPGWKKNRHGYYFVAGHWRRV